MVPWVLLLAGCLERVTGEAVPLDPRFYEGRADEDGRGIPGGGGGGTPGDGAGGPGGPGPGGGETPWADYEGETWKLVGEIVVDGSAEVQIDIGVPDAAAPGGQARVGAFRLAGAGSFEANVPTSVTEVRLQAFQDVDADGPDEDDPFAEGSVARSGSEPATVVLTLVKGARGKAGGGGGGGGSPSGTASPPPDGLAFPSGPTVTVSGTVTSARDLPVVLDFFHANGEGAGGRSYLGKRTVALGAWSQAFPVGYGAVEVEAYQDLTGDSRTGDDPAVRLERPVTIADEDVSGLTLTIP